MIGSTNPFWCKAAYDVRKRSGVVRDTTTTEHEPGASGCAEENYDTRRLRYAKETKAKSE